MIFYYISVERVTLIARFMDSTPLRNILSLQAALANAFCYLITSMDDNNVYVAQRATLYLGTIHDTAIRVNFIKFLKLHLSEIKFLKKTSIMFSQY